MQVETARESVGPLGESFSYRVVSADVAVYLEDGEYEMRRRLMIGRTTIWELTNDELDALEAVVLARKANREGERTETAG
jgi:hypothetical protein